MSLFEMNAVTKTYARHVVLRDVTLEMHQPDILGLIGPNGAGKTTLLRILAGLVRPSDGRVLLGGEPPVPGARKLTVGYFAGETTLPPCVSEPRWRRLMGLVPGQSEGRRFRTLSRGSRQAAGLRAVLDRADTRLVLLDEPYEGLDPDGTRWLSQVLRARRSAGVGAVVSSHRLNDLAGVCERYAFLIGGVLAISTADELSPGTEVTGDTLMAAFDALTRRPS